MEVTYIYTLLLTNNKYYIGKTTQDPQVRFQQHLSDQGTKWTAKYKPLKIIDTYESNCHFAEDKTTKEYMIKFGIENVRGGSYCLINLPDWQIQALEHEFKSIKNKCKKPDHYAKECKQYHLDLEKKEETKYLDKFTSIYQLTQRLDLINLHIINIDKLNLIMKQTNTNTAIIPKFDSNGYIIEIIFDPSTYKPITVIQYNQVIDYFDNLIENKIPKQQYVEKFRDIFNITSIIKDPFIIIRQPKSTINMYYNPPNNNHNNKNLIQIKENFVSVIDKNINARIKINDFLGKNSNILLTNKYTCKDRNYDDLLKELKYIKQILTQKKYNLFNTMEIYSK